MDALRSGIRRLVAGARRSGHAGGSIDISDPRNVAATINTGGRGSVSSVSSRQTVVSQGGNTRIRTERSSRTEHRNEQRPQDREESDGRYEDPHAGGA